MQHVLSLFHSAPCNEHIFVEAAMQQVNVLSLSLHFYFNSSALWSFQDAPSSDSLSFFSYFHLLMLSSSDITSPFLSPPSSSPSPMSPTLNGPMSKSDHILHLPPQSFDAHPISLLLPTHRPRRAHRWAEQLQSWH